VLDLCSIRKLQTAIRQFEETLKDETSLSLNDAMCLCAITKDMHEPGLIAKELELSPSRLTRILDALEERKLVTRHLSETDRRSIEVAMTESGKRLVKKYRCADIPVPEELAFIRK
jgi:DNA-binding MarR family transcriptional regulator